MKKALVILLVVATMTCLFASGANEAQSSAEKHTLAVSIPLTGSMAQYGQSYINGITLAVEDFNKKGGLNGQDVVIKVNDDAGNQTEALNIANLIAEDKDVFAFVGSYGSSTSLVMAPIMQEARIPMVSPNTSHPDFFEIGDMMMPLSAMSNICFDEVGRVIVKDYSPKKIGMIYQNNDSGVTIDETFKKVFKELNVGYASQAFTAGESNDYTPIISSLCQSGIDTLIICADYSSGSQIVIQTKQLGYSSLRLVGISNMLKPQLLGLCGEYGEGMIFCSVQRLYTDDVLAANDYGAYCMDIINRYKQAYPNVMFDSAAALAYDAATLACYAAKEVGTNNPEALVKYMKELHNELCSGKAWFAENGDFYRGVYSYKIENGQYIML